MNHYKHLELKLFKTSITAVLVKTWPHAKGYSGLKRPKSIMSEVGMSRNRHRHDGMKGRIHSAFQGMSIIKYAWMIVPEPDYVKILFFDAGALVQYFFNQDWKSS